jgi:hypothetical protein
MPIDPGAVVVNPGAGTASVIVSNHDIDDYGNVVNALTGGAEVSASVSFAINWSGVQQRLNLSNPDLGFAGEYVHTAASLVWSATESGSSFTANPLAADFAEIGHERNGVFFTG